MSRARNPVRAALAAGVVLAVTASAGVAPAASPRAPEPAAFNPKEISVDRFAGAIRGMVVARRLSARTVFVQVAVRGLPVRGGRPTPFQLVADRRGCTARAAGGTDGSDFLVWRAIIMANTEGDALVARRATLRAGLDTARSVRVYERGPRGSLVQRGCGVKWEPSELDA